MEKLISMTDFVLQFGKEENRLGYEEAYDAISAYANFLKQPLTLGMFVPVMSNGVAPTEEEIKTFENTPLFEEYQEAKNRVLFEGFEAIKWEHGGNSYSVRKNHGTDNEVQVCYYKAIPDYFVWSFDNIEQLTNKHLVLTPTAQKQIGL